MIVTVEEMKNYLRIDFEDDGRRDSDGCGGFEVESDVPEE